MKKIISFIAFISLLFASQSSTFAATSHTVQKGETYWKIANAYGVSVDGLMSVNHANSNVLFVGQTLTVPTVSITSSEKDLLARLVEAEAKGEPYAGKVAVATVILNRVDSNLFPNSVKSVIYQSGQFTPVSNGQINNPASSASKQAVNEAIAFHGQGHGSLYFYNPSKTTNTWLRSKTVTIKIGNHVFAK
jgi:N-acetylmuramoyl-L-alanine amidase